MKNFAFYFLALCVFLAAENLCSLDTNETVLEEIIPLELPLNEFPEEQSTPYNDQIALSEGIVQFGDFTGGIAELPSETLTESASLNAEQKNNALYFFVPTGSSRFFLPGVAFRHHLSRDFFEISYFNQKQSDIFFNTYNDFSEVKSQKKLGTIYENILNAFYGLRWNTRYISPYLSLGTGLYFPHVQYNGNSSVGLLPTLATALGVEFKYGFADLAINYLPIKWKTVFEYQEPGYEETYEKQMRILGNIRLGVGLPF
jgi:hypothetical protein